DVPAEDVGHLGDDVGRDAGLHRVLPEAAVDPTGGAAELGEVRERRLPGLDAARRRALEDEERPVVDLVADGLEGVGAAVERERAAAPGLDGTQVVDDVGGGEPGPDLVGLDATGGEHGLERVPLLQMDVLVGPAAGAALVGLLDRLGAPRRPGRPLRAGALRRLLDEMAARRATLAARPLRNRAHGHRREQRHRARPRHHPPAHAPFAPTITHDVGLRSSRAWGERGSERFLLLGTFGARAPCQTRFEMSMIEAASDTYRHSRCTRFAALGIGCYRTDVCGPR